MEDDADDRCKWVDAASESIFDTEDRTDWSVTGDKFGGLLVGATTDEERVAAVALWALWARGTLCSMFQLAHSAAVNACTATINSGTDVLRFWSVNSTAFLTLLFILKYWLPQWGNATLKVQTLIFEVLLARDLNIAQ